MTQSIRKPTMLHSAKGDKAPVKIKNEFPLFPVDTESELRHFPLKLDIWISYEMGDITALWY